MTEPVSLAKGIRKKKDPSGSRSFLYCGGTPLGEVNGGRLSLMSNARLQKITGNSLERLSFISEKDGCDNSDFENYHLAYSVYLLNKAQNRVLTKNKADKEENLKKCFVSLKWELEGLLERYVKLSKGIGYFKIFLEVIEDCNSKIEVGKSVLNTLRENNFESLLKSLSNSLDRRINQLQLIDVDKAAIEKAFSKNAWGSGSEIDECLKKIDACSMKNRSLISDIATALTDIKRLSLENSELQERFSSLFHRSATEILETNYTLFTDAVRKAFEKRKECKTGATSHFEEFDIPEFLLLGLKQSKVLTQQQSSLQLSNFESPYPVRPNSASTPQPD